MTDAFIEVGMARTKVTNLNFFQINDIYQNAPEPPHPSDVGMRTVAANLLYLNDTLPTAVWHDPNMRLLEARTMRFLSRLRPEEPGEYEANFPFKTVPRDFQLKVFCYARRMTRIALAPAAVGTGKSKMALDVAAAKWLENEIDVLVIIAPAGVHSQWIKEAVPTHLSDAVPRVCAIWKSTRKLVEAVWRAPRRVIGQRDRQAGDRLRIAAFNVEAFQRKGSKAQRDLRALMATGRVMIVMDEATRIKDMRASRTRTLAYDIAPRATVRMTLTGTPITKGMEDLFSQFYFLDPDIIGLSTPTTFQNRYTVMSNVAGEAAREVGARSIIGYKNQEELIRKIAPFSFMISKDVLGLPPQRWVKRHVPLTREQDEIYTMLRDRLVEDLQSRAIRSPTNAGVRLLRLQQVVCGRYIVNVGTEEQPIDEIRRLANNRPSVLMDVLEDHDGQALIWARFREDIDDIGEFLAANGKTFFRYDGRTSLDEREEGKRGFRAGDFQYGILNQAAGSTGVDGLQVASLNVFYSNSFNAEHRWQAEGRIHRIGTAGFIFPGQEVPSVCHLDLVAPRTTDVLNLMSMRRKRELANALMSDPTMLLNHYEEQERESEDENYWE